MRAKKHIKKLASVGICMSSVVFSSSADPTIPTPREFEVDGSIHQDFTGWDGKMNTLETTAPGFFGEMAGSMADEVPSNLFHGEGDGSQGGGSAAGLWAYGLGTGGTRSFGMFETGGTSDPRLHLHFKNNTASAIARLLVSFRMELWRDGERLNGIQAKYNTSTDGYSSINAFLSLTAPFNNGTDAAVVGTDVGNYTEGSALVVLPSTLAINDTAFIRWQLSTESGSGTRDGLGINDITIEALPGGTDQIWDGGNGNWSDAKWNSSHSWPISGNNNAVFGSSMATVTVDQNVDVVDLIFNAPYTLNGSSTITLSGVVNVDLNKSATISAPIQTANRLYKLGYGSLILSGSSHLFNKGVAINEGQLHISGSNVIPTANRVEILTNSGLYLDDSDLTINGIGGGGSVDLGGHNLTLDTTGTRVRFDGDISGIGSKVTKTGNGTQTFRTVEKTYTGATEIRNGVLEITESAIPKDSSSITVNSLDGADLVDEHDVPTGKHERGELALITSEPTAQTFSFGKEIVVDDANLSANASNGILLTDKIVVQGEEPHIDVSGAATVLTVSGEISGSSWRKQGAGTLYLSGTNTFTGELNVNNGTVVIAHGYAFPEDASLFFGDGNTVGREVVLQDNVTVSELRGNVDIDEVQNPPGLTPADYAVLDIGENTFTVAQAFNEAEEEDEVTPSEDKPSYQGEIIGDASSAFVKKGYGTTRLTRFVKNFDGAVEVNEGVLQMSSEGQVVSGTNPITVAQGGQVRLSSGNTTKNPGVGDGGYYHFNGRTISLASTERVNSVVGAPTTDTKFGVLGGLRFDSDLSANEYFGVLAAPVYIAGASDIHVSGVGCSLTLTGALTGSASLNRTGGGELIIAGNASGYTGTMSLTNGTTTLPNSAALACSIITVSGSSSPVLKVDNAITTTKAVNVAGGTTLKLGSESAQIGTTANMTAGTGWVLDLDSKFTTSGTRTILQKTGGGSFSVATPTVLNAGTATVSVDTIGRTVTVTVP